jgi:hypothetical protein
LELRSTAPLTTLKLTQDHWRIDKREILPAIKEDLAAGRTRFDGSAEWHMERVQLDLEVRQEISRMERNSVTKFALVN